jgi:hypothetical protein
MSQQPQPKPWQRPVFWTSLTGFIAGIGVVASILWPGLSLADRAKLAAAFAGIGISLGNLGSSFSFNGAVALHAENRDAISDVAVKAGVAPPEPRP